MYDVRNMTNAYKEVKKMIKVSETAAGKLKEIIEKQTNPSGTMLRVEFGGYG